MATTTTTKAEQKAQKHTEERGGFSSRLKDPSFFAFTLLWLGFIAIPLIAGIDKFFHGLAQWDLYLWAGFSDTLPLSAVQVMYAVGIIEIAAAVVVLVAPRIGGWVVAGWLAGVVANLVVVATTTGRYWDIALRDAGLAFGAIALALLALQHGPRWPNRETVDLSS